MSTAGPLEAARGVGPSVVGQLLRDRSLRLAAGLAVAVSIALSIDACIWLGAVCYLPLGAAATALMNTRAPSAAADRPAYA